MKMILLRKPSFEFKNIDVKFPIYKFTQRSYAEKFLSDGSLRLNTLFYYTDLEQCRMSQGDASEGFINPINDTSLDDEAFQGTYYTTLSQNQWTYCATKNPDFIPDEGFKADCRFTITNEDFFLEISKVLAGLIAGAGLKEMIYYDKTKQWRGDKNMFAGFAKDKSFAFQEEIRCCWEPLGYKQYTDLPVDKGFHPSRMHETAHAIEYRKRENERVKFIDLKIPAAIPYVTDLKNI